MPSAKTSLVIVESPSKAKTIGKYLGPGFTVKASMGHLRDLPKSAMGIDIEHDFEPEYLPLKGKEDVISDLKKTAAKAENVYLATDPDREGEAISWHLKYLLDIPDDKTYRVTFNEITKDVVQTAIRQPRAIDQDLVDAQQARRVLDRIVGYEISPVLWKKVRRGLSAGRVQSVATRMVDDRDREIEQFQPQEYWSLDVKLSRVGKSGSFTAHYYGDPEKRELKNEADVQRVLKELADGKFSVASVKNSTKQYKPAPPFTTSTLQQDAFRKLGMSTRRTMMIAQQLYEGVELTGEGSVGLITYMRTDSLRISEQALAAAGGLVKSRYGSQFYDGPRQYKPKTGAQDAHEAIRPSNVLLTPETVEKDLTKEQYRLYKLIWDRFVASQMTNAIDDVTAIEAVCGRHMFHATHQSRRFSGYTAVYEEGRDEEQEKLDSALPELTEGEELKPEDYQPQQHFTKPPAHYTEATLVRALEEQGIGRPSTYAPTVSTIMHRNYVKK
ncbi:MAG: type I DNA topoisomerase, partial [Clostridia bacterium]|nr:type I DNA topoisomerase [Clostridia bacterium]